VTSWLPDPLHPAVVHFPIALSVLVPLLALLSLSAIARGFVPERVWAVVVLAQALLVGTAWYLGGNLVYEHGAASAYVHPARPGGLGESPTSPRE